MLVAAIKGGGNQKKQSDGQKKQGGEKKSQVTCYYCLKKGHITRVCRALKSDRAEGVYRPTVKCQAMTKEQFEALPAEEKTRGKAMVAAKEEKNEGVATVTVPQDAGFKVVQRSLEDEWIGYAQGN